MIRSSFPGMARRPASAAQENRDAETDAASAAPVVARRKSLLENIGVCPTNHFHYEVMRRVRTWHVATCAHEVEGPRDGAGLDGRIQAPAILQRTLRGPENDAVHQVAERNNQNHDRDDLAHIVQVTAHHQLLPKTDSQENHFRLNQRAPAECPSL